jgi:hypothetical protein
VALWLAIDATFDVPGLGAWGDTAHLARRSCHNTGRALDVMLGPRTAITERSLVMLGESIVRWGAAHHEQFLIRRAIFNRKRASQSSGWAFVPYAGSDPHLAHVHFSVDCDL